ncbi:hypothetical protein CTI14_68735, partial [Methylobacterium radiotolerans]
LAPKTPGTYRLTYSVSLERNPSLSDDGVVTVTVVPPGTNRAPTPIALAPKTPGTYRLTYSVSLERNPSLSDDGVVTVTV